jgi:hypothetical protein
MVVEIRAWQRSLARFYVEKYLNNSCVYLARHKTHDSALWLDMLHVKDIYLSGRSMRVKNGERAHFWGDTWCGSTPLKDIPPSFQYLQ